LPFFGISELLQAFAVSGIDLHIATNKRLTPTILILEHLGWRPYFKSVYALDSSSPTFANKAAMLSFLLSAEKISQNSAIYVGDRVEDNESAIENNLKFYGAAWGYVDQKMLSMKGINCFHTIQQFMRHINNLRL
jgi:phosphoglycolate phosphatase